MQSTIAKDSSSNNTPGALFTKDKLAEHLGVSLRTIENMVKAGEFPPGVRLGRFVYWSEAAVNTWQQRLFSVQQSWRPKGTGQTPACSH